MKASEALDEQMVTRHEAKLYLLRQALTLSEETQEDIPYQVIAAVLQDEEMKMACLWLALGIELGLKDIKALTKLNPEMEDVKKVLKEQLHKTDKEIWQELE